jgi:putative transposase
MRSEIRNGSRPRNSPRQPVLATARCRRPFGASERARLRVVRRPVRAPRPFDLVGCANSVPCPDLPICREIEFTNPTGYQRIVGELAGVGVGVSATTVAKILRQAGVPPAGARAQLNWREFLRAHAASIIACDFFTVDTLWLGRLYVLFFLELSSRRVHVAGCTANPDRRWIVQQARQLAWSLPERETPLRFLIHDRDSKFSRAFDDVFRSEAVEIIRTPFRAPQANAFAERWVGTVRRDCLDWLLIVSRRQLERALRLYVDHYNRHRPHRALALTPPIARPRSVSSNRPDQLHRRDRLGGLIHEYARAA